MDENPEIVVDILLLAMQLTEPSKVAEHVATFTRADAVCFLLRLRRTCFLRRHRPRKGSKRCYGKVRERPPPTLV